MRSLTWYCASGLLSLLLPFACGSDPGAETSTDTGGNASGGNGTGGTGSGGETPFSPTTGGSAGSSGNASGGAVSDPGSGGTAPCEPGTTACSCLSDNTCLSGECVGGKCTTCSRGEIGCTCRSNGECATGGKCNSESNLCVPCENGKEQCGCLPDGTCADGLQCKDGFCEAKTCVDGAKNCACRSSGSQCDSGLHCGDANVCETCSHDVPGCACESGACQGGLICSSSSTSGTCRKAIRCDDLGKAGTCAAHQLCTEVAGKDAACVTATCESGYVWDAKTGACSQSSPTDQNSCDPSIANSVGSVCQKQNRSCNMDSTGKGACGSCVEGTLEVGKTCVLGCGSNFCSTDEFCIADSSGNPTCKARPCPAPQTADNTGACVKSCNLDCTKPGQTGRIWPVLAKDGSCLCEALPGYYIEAGGTGDIVACDSDGDGWVKSAAVAPAIESDPARKDNRRCAIHSIDRVLLQDEYGQALTVTSCSTGLKANATASSCPSTVAIPLVESERNDVQSLVNQDSGVPVYGSNSRKPTARELNPLTKGCVKNGTEADYNDDKVTDFKQSQDNPELAEKQLLPQDRLKSFAYFMELYSSYYQPPKTINGAGALVITERSRCSPSFPLHLSAGDAPAGAYSTDPSNYWRNCARRVDSQFDASAPNVANTDFAYWSKNSPLPGPVDTTQNSSCQGGQQLQSTDRIWRGLNHLSQFKCIRISAGDGPVVGGPASPYVSFNVCKIHNCAADDTTCNTSNAIPGAASGSVEPAIDCAPDAAPPVDAIGWGVVNYTPYGAVYQLPSGTSFFTSKDHTDPSGATKIYDTSQSYSRGCINEDVEWGAKICPTDRMNIGLVGDQYGRASCLIPFEGGYVWNASTGDTTVPGGTRLLFWDNGNWL